MVVAGFDTEGGGVSGRLRGSVGLLLCATLLAVVLVAASAALPEPSAAAAPKIRSLGGGAWSWFGEPRGIHHRGTYNRTYVGWIDNRGNVKVASFDHATRVRTTSVLRWGLEVDDHDNPSLHVRPDGRLIVFYSRHSGGKMYYRVSRRPEDVTAWGSERTLPTNTPGTKGYTYPNPLRLSAERRTWLFWRGGSWQPSFSTSPDDGRSWSPARTLIHAQKGRPYVKYASNGKDTIHLAFTQGNPGSTDTDIHYAYYKRGALHRADGTRIKSMAKLPLLPSEADKVHDTAIKTWVHDVGVDRGGRPAIVYAMLVSATEHHYVYARWTGTRWIRRYMTPAGGSIIDPESGMDERYYSGGITLDHENVNVVYLSREVNGMFEVERWRTPDEGKTWSRQAVTSQSSTKNVRPISPRGLRSFDEDMSVVWMRGTYSTFLNYETDITTRLLNGGNIPPIAEMTGTPKRGYAPLSVRFDARGSRDPDGRRLAYAWNFGDGTRGRGQTPAHTYRSPGLYFPRLTVTDADGDRDVFVGQVLVKRPPAKETAAQPAP